MKSISVVIPNFNGRQLLEENIPPLIEALKTAGVEYEIIISDDASTDQSVKFIESDYPEIILIKNGLNRGFAPTINEGIMKAQKELVLLLNSDITLDKNYFAGLNRYFDREDTFGVMGRIISEDRSKIMDGSKYPVKKGSKIKSTLNYIQSDPCHGQWLPTMFLSGANALVNREKLVALNGFENLFAPFYGEDVDLSLRAWRKGWKCYYEHYSFCYHPLSKTIKTYNKKRKIKLISARNKYILHHFHLDGLDRKKWEIQIRFELALKLLTFKGYYFQAFKEYRKRVPEIERKIREFNAKGKSLKLNEVISEIKKNLPKGNIIRF